MPQPTSSDVHVNAVLTNISTAYIQEASSFIATRVFPIVRVSKKSDSYFTYTKNDWLRDEAMLRAPGTESAGSGYGLSTASYSCDVYAIHKDVADQIRNNADAPLNMDVDATQFVTQRMLIRQELQFQSDAMATSVWATDSTPSALWSSYATSAPITDIETGINTIQKNTGRKPNKLVCGYNVFRYLKHHPDIVDRYKHTTAESVTEQMIARLFGIDELLVATAIKATNLEAETAAYDYAIDGDDALLCYVNPTPSLLQPSAGYTFVWNGVSMGMGADIAIKSFRMEHLESDRIEAQAGWDNKIVGTDLGYFFSEAVA